MAGSEESAKKIYFKHNPGKFLDIFSFGSPAKRTRNAKETTETVIHETLPAWQPGGEKEHQAQVEKCKSAKLQKVQQSILEQKSRPSVAQLKRTDKDQNFPAVKQSN